MNCALPRYEWRQLSILTMTRCRIRHYYQGVDLTAWAISNRVLRWRQISLVCERISEIILIELHYTILIRENSLILKYILTLYIGWCGRSPKHLIRYILEWYLGQLYSFWPFVLILWRNRGFFLTHVFYSHRQLWRWWRLLLKVRRLNLFSLYYIGI
jgi:hypothetical protein